MLYCIAGIAMQVPIKILYVTGNILVYAIWKTLSLFSLWFHTNLFDFEEKLQREGLLDFSTLSDKSRG
jgi:hypothetical protein